MLTLTSLGNLETPVKLTHMSLNCVGKLEYLERTYTSIGRTYSTEKELNQLVDLNPRPPCCEVTALTDFTFSF